MVLCRHARRPLQMMLAAGQGSCRKNYYSTWTYKATLGNSQFSDTKTVFNSGFGMLLRGFSSGADQMNLIKKLRERTSAPIKDVKAALVDCSWDIEAAQTDLRKKGKVLAAKKSGRAASEGLLALAQSETKAAIIELNCETDFVARNDIFQHLALALAKRALQVENTSQQVSWPYRIEIDSLEQSSLRNLYYQSPPDNIAQDMKVNLEHPKISGATTIQSAVTEVAAMMGENVKLRRGFVISTSSPNVLSTYLHASPQLGLGRLAGFLSLEVEDGNAQLEALQRVGSELAMHVVAAKPLFLTKELVSSEALDNEHAVLKSQAESTGKSQMAIEKMVEGRLRKYYEDVVLVEQKFVLNDTLNIQTLLKNLSKEVGTLVKIGNFFRMEVGEGIQREDASNSDEPVAQAA